MSEERSLREIAISQASIFHIGSVIETLFPNSYFMILMNLYQAISVSKWLKNVTQRGRILFYFQSLLNLIQFLSTGHCTAAVHRCRPSVIRRRTEHLVRQLPAVRRPRCSTIPCQLLVGGATQRQRSDGVIDGVSAVQEAGRYQEDDGRSRAAATQTRPGWVLWWQNI